jgi:hypothetical protein
MDKGYWPYSATVCKFQGFVMSFAVAASMANMAAIAFTRMLSIAHPVVFKRMKRCHFLTIAGCAWLSAALVITPSVAGWGQVAFSPRVDSCLIVWTFSWSYTYFTFVAIFVIPLIVVAFCYFRIFGVFWASRSKLGRGGDRVGVTRREKQLAVQLLLLLVACLISWLPYMTVVVFVDTDHQVDRSVYDVVCNFIVFNCITDPCVYFFFNRNMRAEAKRLLCPCLKNNTVRQVGPSQSSPGS